MPNVNKWFSNPLQSQSVARAGVPAGSVRPQSQANRPALARNVAAGQQASMGAERMGQVGYRAAGQGIPATSQYFGSTPNLRRTANMSAGPNDPLFGDQFDMGMDAGMDDDDTGMGSPRPQLPHHGNPLPGKPAGPWMPGDPRPSPYQRPTGGPRPATPTTPATHAPWKDRPAGALTLGGVTGSSGTQGPPGQAGAAGPSGMPPHRVGGPFGPPDDPRNVVGTVPVGGQRPVPPPQPVAQNPPAPRPSGFNPWTPPGGWGPAGPDGFPLPTPPTVTPGPPPSPRPTPGPPPAVLPKILQGTRDAIDWAQDAYAEDPTVQAIDKMERESAPQPGKTRRFPDANRVRNRGEIKRDWAKRKTEEFKARQEAERAQEQMEQERLESERTGGPRVAPQFNRRPRGSAAFRPVNRLW